MKRYTRILFVYSFTSFLFVVVFGALNAPLKKAFYGTEIWNNITAFHNHFDQLCWLGAAAIGALFHFMSDRFTGSAKIAGIFTYLYICGTLTFSMAFLVRGLGIYLHLDVLEKKTFVLMIMTGGLAYIFLIVSGIYLLQSFFKKGKKNESTW